MPLSARERLAQAARIVGDRDHEGERVELDGVGVAAGRLGGLAHPAHLLAHALGREVRGRLGRDLALDHAWVDADDVGVAPGQAQHARPAAADQDPRRLPSGQLGRLGDLADR